MRYETEREVSAISGYLQTLRKSLGDISEKPGDGITPKLLSTNAFYSQFIKFFRNGLVSPTLLFQLFRVLFYFSHLPIAFCASVCVTNCAALPAVLVRQIVCT